jgi:hypothetical protein
MQIAWRACRLTARMGFRHPHVPAVFRHLLATLTLGRRHSRTGQCARRDRLRDQHQRQSGNTEFDQQSQTSSVYLQLTIRRNRWRKVSAYLRHLVGQPNPRIVRLVMRRAPNDTKLLGRQKSTDNLMAFL